MAFCCILHKLCEPITLSCHCKVLNTSKAQVAFGNAHHDCAGLYIISKHSITGSDGCQRSSGGHAQMMHGLRNQILPDNGPHGRLAIASAGVGCLSRTLELDVIVLCRTHRPLAEQDGSPIPQLGIVLTKLMASVNRCSWACAFQCALPCKDGQCLVCFSQILRPLKLLGEGFIPTHPLGRAGGVRIGSTRVAATESLIGVLPLGTEHS